VGVLLQETVRMVEGPPKQKGGTSHWVRRSRKGGLAIRSAVAGLECHSRSTAAEIQLPKRTTGGSKTV
ncbi:hypothetical protein HAX54_050556, partial [Datura stramonium]|nr:hypothetical protein [Datura stramonium]